MVKRFRVSVLAAAACFMAGPVFACAVLDHGDPKVGSVVSASVDHVTLAFTGKIYPEKSTLVVTAAGGGAVSVGKAYGDDTTLSVRLRSPLAPGKYKVRWNTYCECKSYTPGDYKFTVQ